MNPWHDLNIGKNAPDIVTALIEIPVGSQIKYELDKQSGLIYVDRILSSCVFYPQNYGFIPQTYCDDKDPLDILVFGSHPVVPMSIMTVRVIGAMNMIDGGETDDKILAVHIGDPAYKDIVSISQISQLQLSQLKRFFSDYKALENKKVEVGDFQDEKKAKQIVQDAITCYKKEFPKKV